METKSNENKQEFKELVIGAGELLYNGFKYGSDNKMLEDIKNQANYLTGVIYSSERDKDLLSEKALKSIDNITMFLREIKYIKESPNLGLKYDYRFFGKFLESNSPAGIREWLSDVLFGYSCSLEEEYLYDFKKAAENLGRLNIELSFIKPIV